MDARKLMGTVNDKCIDGYLDLLVRGRAQRRRDTGHVVFLKVGPIVSNTTVTLLPNPNDGFAWALYINSTLRYDKLRVTFDG